MSSVQNRRLTEVGALCRLAFDARNDFTRARAAYDRRLTTGSISATVEDAVRVERRLTPAIAEATGANFPDAIQAAAAFISDRLFIIA